MKLKVRHHEGTDSIFVTNLSMGYGFPGDATVEVKPGGVYGSHPYRRLKRWCGEGGQCEREVAGPAIPGEPGEKK